MEGVLLLGMMALGLFAAAWNGILVILATIIAMLLLLKDNTKIISIAIMMMLASGIASAEIFRFLWAFVFQLKYVPYALTAPETYLVYALMVAQDFFHKNAPSDLRITIRLCVVLTTAIIVLGIIL